MSKVYKLGKRTSPWIALPFSLALGAATALLWPQPPASEVLVALENLSSGTVVDASNFTKARVQLGNSASLYLVELLDEGVLAQPIRKGELLTRADVTPTPLQTRIPTVLVFKDTLPARLGVGSQVDVWATEQAGEPMTIGLDCEVSNIRADNGLGQRATAVEVQCLPEFLPGLLKAKASQAAIALVLQQTLLNQ
jgi:hypothetical protein